MADSRSPSPPPTAPKHQIPTKSVPKSPFALFTSRRAMAFAYGFTFAFVAFTVFLVFNNASRSSSPSLNALLKTTTTSSYRSHFSSFFSHFLPNTTSQQQSLLGPSFSRAPNTQFQFSGKSEFSGKKERSNGTKESVSVDKSASSKKNDSSSSQKSNQRSQNPTFQISGNKGLSRENGLSGKEEFSKKKEGSNGSSKYSLLNESGSSEINVVNGTVNSESLTKNSGKDGLGKEQIAQKRDSGKEKGVVEKASYAALMSKESDSNESNEKNWMELMNNCNVFDGRWVRDDLYPLYAPGSCPHIDEPFNCFLNSRPDNGFQKYKWQPKDCNIPRLNGSNMLELLRNKRLVFVGDSLNRNMWESLVCILRNSVEDKRRVFEASGRQKFRTEGSYSFIFKDYNCSVEFFRSPFLVQEWELPDTDGSKKETLRLDVIERSSDKYKSSDVLVFNTGHWWTHEKTSKGKGYYQEGSHVYGELNVKEAFRKALTTWARWVDANINPTKTLVFFRGYSASHFRGGQWNSGAQCDSETEPIKNIMYLAKYPAKMSILESVLKGMKTPVFYLNITRMTDFRRDAHPSIYREQYLTEEERRSPLRFQDCSHWCLPGVPDTWNEVLYAQLLIKHNQKQQE